ncbi:hypothetical protein BJ138DRAFT_1120360 [Hygrophoropsis aurantiaca]|uniref:Uncharacterized protein n=1 Tax=Hygrophoropsis aurantiaca TaxID=72124 RepID=A0ACB7ZRK4_9AGAM|nr:hypothetical protein BJ138DRAFT_1120360 [Hygrophoropsis aurantiaca]
MLYVQVVADYQFLGLGPSLKFTNVGAGVFLEQFVIEQDLLAIALSSSKYPLSIDETSAPNIPGSSLSRRITPNVNPHHSRSEPLMTPPRNVILPASLHLKAGSLSGDARPYPNTGSSTAKFAKTRKLSQILIRTQDNSSSQRNRPVRNSSRRRFWLSSAPQQPTQSSLHPLKALLTSPHPSLSATDIPARQSVVSPQRSNLPTAEQLQRWARDSPVTLENTLHRGHALGSVSDPQSHVSTSTLSSPPPLFHRHGHQSLSHHHDCLMPQLHSRATYSESEAGLHVYPPLRSVFLSSLHSPLESCYSNAIDTTVLVLVYRAAYGDSPSREAQPNGSTIGNEQAHVHFFGCDTFAI